MDIENKSAWSIVGIVITNLASLAFVIYGIVLIAQASGGGIEPILIGAALIIVGTVLAVWMLWYLSWLHLLLLLGLIFN